MGELTEVASGLRFPEGPVAMPDGSVLVVEIFAERLVRVTPDGAVETVAEIPGGPNGAAVGPDGAIYVCNNGGRFTEVDLGGLTLPGPVDPQRYRGGRVQRVELDTGAVTDLYTECDGNPLWAPNDLVFDDAGGFYFTDHGYAHERDAKITGVYYAQPDGSSITEVVFPAHEPNGIGLSPDGSMLYWAETWTGRLLQRRIVAPGVLEEGRPADPSGCLHGFGGVQLLDSMAVDADGDVCVAVLGTGGIATVSPAGEQLEFLATGDPLTTNICFGGDDARTAWITLSGTGRLVRTTWPRPGHPLAFPSS